MIKYKLKEIKPRIFLLTFKDKYDMCMTFLRYQECYESPNVKFRGKKFTFIDFMEWYSKNQSKGCFEYPNHWSGFNVPSYVFNNACGLYRDGELNPTDYELTCWKWSDLISDYNKYDKIMERVYKECINVVASKYNDNKFYLIGAMEGNISTINHEIAHGFFYTIPSYKKEMLDLVKKLDSKFKISLYKDFKKLGYTKQVFPDEAQAFLATGWRDYLPKRNGEDKAFIKVFKKYNNTK